MSQVGSDRVQVLQHETSLRRAPGDAELAALLTRGTTLTVLERQEEWVKVSIEGWVPAAALMATDPFPVARPLTTPDREVGSAAGTPSQAEATGSSSTSRRTPHDQATRETTVPTVGVVKGSRVEGQVQLRIGRHRRASTAGLEVMLLPADFHMESSPLEQERLAVLDADARRLQRQADRAMRDDSFTQAMARRDALMKQRSIVLDERTDLLAALHGRHQAAARHAALATVITDAQGWYSIAGVSSGSYTVYARLVRDKNNLDVEWIEPLAVADDVVRHDLDESTAAGLLDRSD